MTVSKLFRETDAILWIAVLVVVVLCVIAACFGGWPPSGSSKFNDVFVALTALFTGLAFAGLIHANNLQRQELALQRLELAETREEIKGQKEQLEKQSETFRLQLIESSFFQLLASHSAILNSIDLNLRDNVRSVGRDCFVTFRNRLKFELDKAQRDLHLNMLTDQGIEAAYARFYREHEKDVAHYFRSLYNLVKFIDNAQIDDKRKGFYANLVRAQLSSQELFVMFFNGLSVYGREKLKPLVEKYQLLKHINIEELTGVGAQVTRYEVSATQRIA